MNFIILGDKFQKRRKTKGCPGLFKLDKETIIEHQYKTISKNFTQANIIYVYGFDAKRLLSFIEETNSLHKKITLLYNDFHQVYNYAYSLYLAKKYLDQDTFIMFGDSVIEKNFFKTIDVNKDSQIAISNNKTGSLGCVLHEKLVQNIFYDLDNSIEEIYFLKEKDARSLAEILNNTIYHNYFVFELINKLIDNDVKIEAKLFKNVKSGVA